MTEEKETVEVAKHYFKALKKAGPKRVISALQNLHKQKISEYDNKVIDYIIESVCNAYEIKEHELNGNTVTGDALVSRNMVVVLIKKHLRLKHEEVSVIFNKKGHAMVSHALRDFKGKNERIKEDKIYIDHFFKVDSMISNYKKTFN